MPVIISQFLIVSVYLGGMLLTDAMFLNSIESEAIYFIPVVAGLVVLLEHYTSIHVVKRNSGLLKHLNIFLLAVDIIVCIGVSVYIASHFDTHFAARPGSALILAFHFIQLACRTCSLFNTKALEKMLLSLWGGVTVIHHFCAVLYIEIQCAVIALLAEEPMRPGLVMTGVSIAVLLLAEHYWVLHQANEAGIGKKAIDIILTILDIIVVLPLPILLLTSLIGGVSIGSVLYIVLTQLLVLLPRFKYLSTK